MILLVVLEIERVRLAQKQFLTINGFKFIRRRLCSIGSTGHQYLGNVSS